MKAWIWLLSGLIIWAAHFMGAYIIASLFPGTELARWLVLLLTAAGLGSAGLIVFLLVRRSRSQREALDRWISALAGLGNALALVAIIYQGLPALLV